MLEYKGNRAEKKIEEMTENIPNLINEIKPQTLEAGKKSVQPLPAFVPSGSPSHPQGTAQRP